MKYLFFVQGEGRGHLTQALTLKEKLEKCGHTISAIIVGSNNKLPNFFQELINVPFFQLNSPGFVVDKKDKGIKIFSSVLRNIWQAPLYLKSLKKIKKIINDLNPDVLINFYEPLISSYYRLYRDKRPLFCFGHQYFVQHPIFKFPSGQYFDKLSFKFYNYLNAPKKCIKIALSFTSEPDQEKNKLFICPPLIRQTIKDQIPTDEKFLLLYILNSGYSEEIINWGKNNSFTKIEAFWNQPEKEETNFGQNLTFHPLSGEKFINYLSRCSAYASTAGFDSICEAAYLQKAILMVPTKNHFEQQCNALDAHRAGLAISATDFNLDLIIKSQNKNTQALINFKSWVDNYDDKIVKLLEK